MLARYTFENNTNDSVGAGGPSAVLLATGFGFTVPTGSVIQGVEAWVERSASSMSGSVSDNEVHLLKAGAQVGSNFAATATYNTSDGTEDYGASNNLWGTTWTAEEINASNFGLRFRVDSDTPVALTSSVDAITIRVTYLPPPTTSIGVSGTNVLQAHIAGDCTLPHAGCAHAVHPRPTRSTRARSRRAPSGLSKPQIDMAFWYNQRPSQAPRQACTTTVGTPPVVGQRLGRTTTAASPSTTRGAR